jgi:acetyl-CoA acetyltransferase
VRSSAPEFSPRTWMSDAKKGLATLCVGGGMGVAMCVER